MVMAMPGVVADNATMLGVHRRAVVGTQVQVCFDVDVEVEFRTGLSLDFVSASESSTEGHLVLSHPSFSRPV